MVYLDELELVPEVACVVGLNKLVNGAGRVGKLPPKRGINRIVLQETVGESIGHGGPANSKACRNEAENAHHLHSDAVVIMSEIGGLSRQNE